jgi:hypothetical protein
MEEEDELFKHVTKGLISLENKSTPATGGHGTTSPTLTNRNLLIH